MSWQTWLLVVGIALAGLVQYGLMIYAVRDLLRRPRVRGDNKVAWGLFILMVPFVGALVYTIMGPTSFLPRANRPPTRPPAGSGAARGTSRGTLG